MLVTILHQAVAEDATADELDVLAEVAAARNALLELGHQVDVLPCTLDLSKLQTELLDRGVDCVFNLVESLGGSDSLAHLVPAALESYRIPFTGSPSEVLVLSNSKPLAKRWMRAGGLPTPDWYEVGNRRCAQAGISPGVFDADEPIQFIVKPSNEHASRGMDDQSVVRASTQSELARAIGVRADRLKCLHFAEQYIEGREFNLSVLAGPHGPVVLPPAEIVFEGFSEHQPHIVDYRAKWVPESYEYHHTPRRFDFPQADQELLGHLSQLAEQCWDVFRLRGWARVDFRVDDQGQPWILEVNTNPCLSLDAGFAAAVEEAGIPFQHAIKRILADRCGEAVSQLATPWEIDSSCSV